MFWERGNTEEHECLTGSSWRLSSSQLGLHSFRRRNVTVSPLIKGIDCHIQCGQSHACARRRRLNVGRDSQARQTETKQLLMRLSLKVKSILIASRLVTKSKFFSGRSQQQMSAGMTNIIWVPSSGTQTVCLLNNVQQRKNNNISLLTQTLTGWIKVPSY